jgi:O-antigen/teichoic acid export membrane protein
MRSLISAILKTGSGSVANLLFGMASVKIIAILLGPSGVGLFSLLRNTMLTLAAVGPGGQTALVQGVASKENAERNAYIRSIFWLFVFGSIITVVLIELFSPLIAALLFGSNDSQSTNLIRWIALPVVLSNAYIFLKSLINGFREIGKLALVEMMGPLVMLLLVYPTCILVGRKYALAFVWMLSASQAVMLFTSFMIVHKSGWIATVFTLGGKKIDKAASLYFFKISGTTLFTGILATGAILAVRAMIVKHGGFHEAGLFDLAWSLSGAYVMLLLGSFGTYYMPLLSGISEPSARLHLIRKVIRLSTLMMVPMIVAVVVLKPLVVSILYTKEFIPSLKIVRWMLIGDYFKITGWVLAIAAFANADMKVYFWGETFWCVGFVLLAMLAIRGFGELQGVGAVFLVLYACYVFYYIKYVQKNYGLRLTLDVALPWSIGLAVVLLASMQTWDTQVVNWGISITWVVVSFIFVWMMLKKEEKSKMLNAFFNRGKNDL